MDLDAQIQTLIADAPKDGVTPQAVETIAPTLKAIATQLRHLQYYVMQTVDQGWVMTTVGHQNQPGQQRNLVYAFPTLQDAASGPNLLKDPQLMALPVPVIQILFQMLALKSIDSIVFFETPGNLNQALEIRRDDIQRLLQMNLQQAQTQPPIPPDIA